MHESRTPPINHSETGDFIAPRTEVVQKMFSEPLSAADKSIVDEKMRFYEASDTKVYDDIQELREEVGTLEGWKIAKEKASAELVRVPSDTLERIMERFAPFIKNLPTGHSKGHFLRDTVNLSMIFQDSSISKYDPVEAFTGMLGAMYHDIGNSVVDRYAEARNFSGHAEVGAHLFGDISKDLIGENLRKLAMLTIAGHTHYLRDRSVEKNGETRITAPYDDDVIDGNRMSYWWTRQADRMDAQGAIMDVRHLVTKADPTEDFGGGQFHQVWDSPEDDFRHQFSPVIRTHEERSSKGKPESTQNVLEHVKMFADSNFNPNLPYAKHDNPFYTQLIEEEAESQNEFVGAVTDETTTIQEEKMGVIFEKFFRLCELIEPAENTREQIEKMRRKFELLSQSERSHWANGFRILTDRLFPRRYQRFKAILDYPSPVAFENRDEGARKVEDIINNHMYPLAAEVWSQFDPKRIA